MSVGVNVDDDGGVAGLGDAARHHRQDLTRAAGQSGGQSVQSILKGQCHENFVLTETVGV